jgi:hypothetical protein
MIKCGSLIISVRVYYYGLLFLSLYSIFCNKVVVVTFACCFLSVLGVYYQMLIAKLISQCIMPFRVVVEGYY